jgi:hypothetical protein
MKGARAGEEQERIWGVECRVDCPVQREGSCCAAAAGGVSATLPIQARSCCSSLVVCRTWLQNYSRCVFVKGRAIHVCVCGRRGDDEV